MSPPCSARLPRPGTRPVISNISRTWTSRRPGKLIGPTGDNLKAAIASETHEYTDVYPGMARVARREGFDEIADWFETLAKAGKSHAGRFQKALEENWNTIGGKHGRND